MGKMKLSIIVPVYKTGKTLYRCLDSIFSQIIGHETEIEIIAVNDASPDDCGDLLLRYQKKHPSLLIITHAQNRGEAGAHNTGIEQSHGDYYTFVDSDDTLRPGAVLRLLEIICAYHPDLIHYAYARVNEQGEFMSRSNIRVSGFYPVDTPDEKAREAIFQDTAFGIMTAGGVYRRGVANDLRMDPQFPISGERYYGWQFFTRCKTVYLLNEMLYDYYQYGDSISRRFSEKAVRGLLELNIRYWNEARQYPLFNSVGKYIFRRIFPAQVGWDYELVFKSEPEKLKFSNIYFLALANFVKDDVATSELGLWAPYLRCAAEHRSKLMVSLYRALVMNLWRRAKNKLHRTIGRHVG